MTTGYYDGSYPPSVFTPPAPKATGATAGIPGTWTPAGATPPADLVELQSGSIVASPTTGWTSGQYVQTGTSGAAGRATWTGTGWVGGAAPLAAKSTKAKSKSSPVAAPGEGQVVTE